jgi:hypothetical protein
MQLRDKTPAALINCKHDLRRRGSDDQRESRTSPPTRQQVPPATACHTWLAWQGWYSVGFDRVEIACLEFTPWFSMGFMCP